MKGTLLNIKDLHGFIEEQRENGKKIVFTNGCFDIVHVGYMKLLNEAKSQGDVLIVGLNSDSSIQRIKDATRPINNYSDRAEILLNIRSVDYVVGFDDTTPVNIINIIKPDIHVKGGDYTIDDVDNFPEQEVVLSYGGKVVIVELIKGKSTSNLLKKLDEI